MHLTLRMQLTVAFLTQALLLAGMGLFSINQLNVVHHASTEIADNRLPSTLYLGRIDAAVADFRVAQFAHNLSTGVAEEARLERDMDEAKNAVANAVVGLEPLVTPGPERELFEVFKKQWARYLDQNQQQFLPLSRRNVDDGAAARFLHGDALQLYTNMDQGLVQLEDLNVTEGQQANDHGASVFADSTKLIIGAMVAALLAAVALGLLVSQRIGRALTQVTAAARSLAQGDLTQHLELRSRDELGQMADAFRIMVAGLRRVTGEVQHSARSLAAASGEITAAVAQQSSSTSERSAAISETTVTVEQVKASAEQAVQLALVVSQTAQEALRVAADGVRAAHFATEGMADLHAKVQAVADNVLALSDQGQQIGEIIATVNDLADQSNLLSLNAAIEASRAGEHGRGFAVVASEIRVLAEQSKAATTQVRALLGGIQRATNAAVLATEQGTRGVDTGTRLVEQTGAAIDQLRVVIEEAAGSAQQIAASVRQHSVGMDQIAGAMRDINAASAQSVVATASTRQSAEHLTELASQLNRLVAQYKVSEDRVSEAVA